MIHTTFVEMWGAASAHLQPLLAWVVRASWQASLIIAVVLLAQWLLRRRVSARWRYNLWLLVLLRLMLPAVPGSRISPFNWLRWSPSPNAAQSIAQTPMTPSVQSPRVVVAKTPDLKPSPKTVPFAAPVRAVHAAPAPASPPEWPSFDIQPAETFSSPITIGNPLVAEPEVEVGTASSVSAAPPAAVSSRSHESDAVARVVVPEPKPPKMVAPPADRLATVTASARSRWEWNWIRGRVIPWAAALWAAGTIVLLFRLAWVSLRLSQMLRPLRPIQDAEVQELLEDCCRHLGVRHAPIALESPEGVGPALVGVFKPCLLLPTCVLQRFDWRELRLVLLHELVHLKRHDVAVNWLMAIVQSLHWFNPLVWAAFARMRGDRELACDEAVLRATPWREGRAYGAAILKLLETASRSLPSNTLSRSATFAGAVGAAQARAQVHRRIAMIARFDRFGQKDAAWSVSGVVLSLLVGGVALTGAVQGQQSVAVSSSVKTTVSVSSEEGQATSVSVVSSEDESAEKAETSVAKSDEEKEEADKDQDASVGEKKSDSTESEAKEEAEESKDANDANDGDKPEAREEAPAETPIEAPSADVAKPGEVAPADPNEQRIEALPSPDSPSITAIPDGAVIRAPEATPELPAPQPGADAAPDVPREPSQPGRGNGRRSRNRAPDMNGQRGRGAMPPVPGDGAKAWAQVEDPAAAKADAKAEEKLQRAYPANFESMPLRDVLAAISDMSGLDIFVDWKVFEPAGIDYNVPITLKIKEPQPVDQLLHWTLRTAGGGRLGFAVSHGIIVVSTTDEMALMVVTRVYDTRNLGNVADLITETVAPDSWRVNGGNASIHAFNNMLVVTATEPNHRQIAKLLNVLQQNPGAEGNHAPAAMLPRMSGPQYGAITAPGISPQPGMPPVETPRQPLPAPPTRGAPTEPDAVPAAQPAPQR